MGWLRSTVPGQHKRAVIATNPPLSAEGLWLTRMFSPWIDPTHPLPAKPGELRWFVTDPDGKDIEVNGPEPVDMDGKSITPLSRTFIPARVKDNPYLSGTDYEKQLHNMVEPYRSLLMGGFRTTFRDQENQVIPLSWVQTAQERWSPNPPYGTPMCALGVDVAAGGEDETVLAPRFDGWYAPLITLPGRETPLPRDVAGAVISHRRDRAIVVLDMGGGYGGGVFEHLRNNEIDVIPWKGAEGQVLLERPSDANRFCETPMFQDPVNWNIHPVCLDDGSVLCGRGSHRYRAIPARSAAGRRRTAAAGRVEVRVFA